MTESRYKIVSNSHTHGEIFELEIEKLFDVIDETTGEVIMTFQQHEEGTMDGSGGWRDEAESGVKTVALSADGKTIQYTLYGADKPITIELPQ